VFSVSSWRMSHFIRNPVSGGRPPRDRTINSVRVVSHGAKLMMLLRSARFDVFNRWKVVNTVPVSVRYIRRLSVLNWEDRGYIVIIQPK